MRRQSQNKTKALRNSDVSLETIVFQLRSEGTKRSCLSPHPSRWRIPYVQLIDQFATYNRCYPIALLLCDQRQSISSTENEGVKPDLLFLCIGQSNMAGRAELVPEDKDPLPGVLLPQQAIYLGSSDTPAESLCVKPKLKKPGLVQLAPLP